MDLTTKDIHKIAKLAKLTIEDSEIDSIKKKLNKILHFAEKMDEIDTSHVQPLSHPLDETQPLREDQVTEINRRDTFQAIAPETRAGLYIVPKVIDSEEESN